MAFLKKKKKEEIKINNPTTYLKAKDLREHFKVTSKHLHEVLNLLKWITKADKKGWNSTSLGIKKGAKDGIYMGISYVHWKVDVINNLDLIYAINQSKNNQIVTNKNSNNIHPKINNQKKEEVLKPKRMSYKEKKEKGDKYEKFIAIHYKTQGYTIAEHGKDNGVKDGGIDIIAKKGKEILFIQCKNWDANGSKKVEAKDIKYTRQDATDYVEANPVYKMYKHKIIYIMAENVLHGSAYHYIQKYHEKVEFKIIPIME